MSNLGGYQLLTTFAKKVGGPRNLVALIAGGGAIIGGLAVKGGERLWNKVKVRKINLMLFIQSCVMQRVMKVYFLGKAINIGFWKLMKMLF